MIRRILTKNFNKVQNEMQTGNLENNRSKPFYLPFLGVGQQVTPQIDPETRDIISLVPTLSFRTENLSYCFIDYKISDFIKKVNDVAEQCIRTYKTNKHDANEYITFQNTIVQHALISLAKNILGSVNPTEYYELAGFHKIMSKYEFDQIELVHNITSLVGEFVIYLGRVCVDQPYFLIVKLLFCALNGAQAKTFAQIKQQSIGLDILDTYQVNDNLTLPQFLYSGVIDQTTFVTYDVAGYKQIQRKVEHLYHAQVKDRRVKIKTPQGNINIKCPPLEMFYSKSEEQLTAAGFEKQDAANIVAFCKFHEVDPHEKNETELKQLVVDILGYLANMDSSRNFVLVSLDDRKLLKGIEELGNNQVYTKFLSNYKVKNTKDLPKKGYPSQLLQVFEVSGEMKSRVNLTKVQIVTGVHYDFTKSIHYIDQKYQTQDINHKGQIFYLLSDQDLKVPGLNI